MLYEQEIIRRVGGIGSSRIQVIVHQPHLHPDNTAVALVMPDERVWDIDDAEDARRLAELLGQAAAEFEQVLADIERQREEEEDDE